MNYLDTQYPQPKFEEKTVITFFSHPFRAQYYIGRIENDRFEIEHHDRINWPGGNLHAPRVLVDGKNRRLFFANINESFRSDRGWHQVMTLPVELRMAPDGTHLLFTPVEELKILRYDEAGETIGLTADQEQKVSCISGDQIELQATLESRGADVFGIKVRCSKMGEEETVIRYDHQNGKLTIDVSNSSSLDSSELAYVSIINAGRAFNPGNEKYRLWQQTAPFLLAEDEPLKLRIYIDHSVLEVFVNERRYLVQRIYPILDDSYGVKVFNDGEGEVTAEIKGWKMAPMN
jgi:beta-fructofuranosidase